MKKVLQITPTLPMAQQKQLDDARRVGFLTTQQGISPIQIRQAFYDWCKQQHRPFAHIHLKLVYATVTIDADTTGQRISQAKMDELAALAQPYWASQNMSYGGGLLTLNVRKGEAENLVRQLLTAYEI